MDPKGKGKVTDEKEKEVLSGDTPKGGETIDSEFGKNKKDKKKKCIKKIAYYDSDASSSSPKDEEEDYSKKRRSNKTTLRRLLITIAFLMVQMLIYSPFRLARLLTLMGKTIHDGVIRCVVVYFHSILVFGT
jgi:cation transport ATPase